MGPHRQWGRIGSGVAFALTAAATFGVALVLTQQEAGDVDGRVRTRTTMSMVGLLALAGVAVQGGFRLPQASVGWWGLAALTFLYGTAFTIMFTVLPKLGVVGNSAIMNVEPVFALVLAWLILGQAIAPVQVAGALLVVGAGLAQTLMDRAAPDIQPFTPPPPQARAAPAHTSAHSLPCLQPVRPHQLAIPRHPQPVPIKLPRCQCLLQAPA